MKKNKLINIVSNTELIPNIFKYDVILFPMGVNNSTSNGFVYEITLNFQEVKESENNTGYGDLRKLGNIHETKVGKIIFVACYIHSGGYKKNVNGSFLNYDALEKCLSEINNKYADKKIATIILGANKEDGLGDKEKILSIFKNTIHDCKLTIYDYEYIDYRLKIFREIATIRKQLKNKEIDKKEYIKLRSEIEWRRKNGIFLVMPKNYTYIPRNDKNKLIFRGSKKQF